MMRFKKRVLKAIFAVAKKEKSLKELDNAASKYFTKRVEFRIMSGAFKALHKHAERQVFTKNGKADELADKHFLLTKGQQIFDAWKKQSKDTVNREKLSMKASIFSAWRHYAKQNSLVKKYLQECDFSSGNYESNFKSPVQNHLKVTTRTLSDENLSPIELKENKGLMSTNHPNVLANTQTKFQYHKYY